MSVRLASLNEVKTYLRIATSETGADTILTTILEAVGAECERFTGRTFTKTTYTDEGHEGDCDVVVLKHFPVDSASAFTVEDRSPIGALGITTLDTSDYVVDYDKGIVRLRGGLKFSDGPDAALITYAAGYASSGTSGTQKIGVPDDLCLSIQRLTAARYKYQRGSLTSAELKEEEDAAKEAWMYHAKVE